MQRFNVSMTVAILGFSLYLLGIAFAPIHTPHLTEALGRSRVYLISLPLFSLFILGAGLSKNFASLAICRFFAGFFGGPCLVLIEGTFADVWRSHSTVTYYSVLSLAAYVGTGAGQFPSFFVAHVLPIVSLTLCRLAHLWLRFRSPWLALDSVGHTHAGLGSLSSRHRPSRDLFEGYPVPESETRRHSGQVPEGC